MPSRAPARRYVRASRPYAPRPYARRSVTLYGRGAYRKSTRTYRRPYLRGRGAYYLKGGANVSGSVPGFGKFSGNATAAAGSNDNLLLTGLGAYTLSNIKHNSLITPDVPQVRNAVYAEGGTIIRHREYLGPIVTSSVAGQFNIVSYPLNPAQSLTFPWLSTISQNYEEYKPNGLMFEFRSTASDAIASSTNLALGQVMMCTQYDPTDPEFNTDIELLNYSWAQSGKVSDNVQHYVECDPKQSPLSHLYTRTGTEASPSDLRFSDFGRFSIATSGLQGTSVQIGQLWVTYEFIMYKPKIGQDQSTGGGMFLYTNRSGSVTSGTIFGNPLSTGDYYDDNNIDIILGYNVSQEPTIAFPLTSVATTYSVDFTAYGDSTVSVAPVGIVQVGSNVKRMYVWDDNISSVSTPTVAATGSVRGHKMVVTILPEASDISKNTVRYTTSGISPANASCCVLINQIPFLNPDVYPHQ
uniref:Capsid protein n=1 Tax=Cressdnaviricota sp. TaxID=2748378 RepID=A0A890UZE5_9VIRU|nr:MAG: capsid protein [Cressdnaviricota sp.]